MQPSGLWAFPTLGRGSRRCRGVHSRPAKGSDHLSAYSGRVTTQGPTGVVGVLLAGGAGRRMGAPKALVRDAAGVPLLFRAVDALLGGGCHEVCVVAGAASDEVEALLRSQGNERPSAVRMTRASDWSTGMGASLRAGLRDVCGGAQDVAVISLVDLPDVTADVVQRVLGRLVLGSDTLARATYNGMPGHPVAVGRAHWQGIIERAQGDRGARHYLEQHRALAIECGDLATGRDVDRPTDLDALAPIRSE